MEDLHRHAEQRMVEFKDLDTSRYGDDSRTDTRSNDIDYPVMMSSTVLQTHVSDRSKASQAGYWFMGAAQEDAF